MEALKSATTKKYIVNALGKELAREIRAMASDEVNSILQSQNPEDLKQFSWDMLLNELSTHAPQLKRLLFLAAKTNIARSNTSWDVCHIADQASQSEDEPGTENQLSPSVCWPLF